MRILLATLLVACSHATVAPRVALPPKPPEPVATQAAPRDLCTRVLDAERAKVDAAIVTAKRAHADWWTAEHAEDDAREAFFGKTGMGIACHPFARGAWAIELDTIELSDPRSPSADVVAVVYVGDERHAEATKTNAGSGGMFTYVRAQLTSDYDKDGVPEFWMRSSADGVEGGHSEESRLLHFANGAVTPYGPATELGSIGEPRDLDGDGLDDLPASLGISLGAGIECFGKADWKPAAFLAHARPDGTFSTNDDVARAFVRSWCASPPAKIASPESALCARLWKQPRAAVTSSCIPWSCVLEGQNKPQPKGATQDCQDRIKAYDATPPFTLP
jgi:hypothetical protein